MTATITKNDLQALVTHDNVDEITELGLSFNIMIGRIRELLDAKVKEQENLKKAELRALQAQINPHFLYNTLDTIIWMTESKKTDQVIEIVRALSSFFRLSLSKGRDWITIGEEVERTRNYLTIQKMRYRDILDYRIEVDECVVGNTILKLILQPLVENALYHGIKNKRQGGTIVVRATQGSEGEILLQVEDNGIGFTPDRLARVQRSWMTIRARSGSESGYRIGNVQQADPAVLRQTVRRLHSRANTRPGRASLSSFRQRRDGEREVVAMKRAKASGYGRCVVSHVLLALRQACAAQAQFRHLRPRRVQSRPASERQPAKKTYQDLIVGLRPTGG